jgi:hypothetical protein
LLVGDIPCVVPDALLWRARWLDRLDEYLWVTASRIEQFAKEAELPGLLRRTRERMRRMIEAKQVERVRIEELFDLVKQSGAIVPAAVPMRREASGRLAVLEYYEHIFRDWSWGAEENARYRALVEHLSPSRPGCLDSNPLPFLVADRLLRGQTVELFEFPRAPRSDACTIVRQELGPPEGTVPGFTLVFADCLQPPFAPESLDAVLTPWFIDATTADVRTVAAVINRALKPGGTWINVGPLHFDTPLFRAYPAEEVLEIAADAGFDVASEVHEPVPYFDSPYSGSKTRELVFGFAATKVGPAPQCELPHLVPAWVSDPELPIPRMQSLAALERTSSFTATVLSMIDGRRSIADLTQALSFAWQLEATTLAEQLRAFFAKLPFE